MCTPPEGQTQCIHEFDLTWARALIELQAKMIVDQERRLRGIPQKPVDPFSKENE